MTFRTHTWQTAFTALLALLILAVNLCGLLDYPALIAMK